MVRVRPIESAERADARAHRRRRRDERRARADLGSRHRAIEPPPELDGEPESKGRREPDEPVLVVAPRATEDRTGEAPPARFEAEGERDDRDRPREPDRREPERQEEASSGDPGVDRRRAGRVLAEPREDAPRDDASSRAEERPEEGGREQHREEAHEDDVVVHEAIGRGRGERLGDDERPAERDDDLLPDARPARSSDRREREDPGAHEPQRERQRHEHRVPAEDPRHAERREDRVGPQAELVGVETHRDRERGRSERDEEGEALAPPRREPLDDSEREPDDGSPEEDLEEQEAAPHRARAEGAHSPSERGGEPVGPDRSEEEVRAEDRERGEDPGVDARDELEGDADVRTVLVPGAAQASSGPRASGGCRTSGARRAPASRARARGASGCARAASV